MAITVEKWPEVIIMNLTIDQLDTLRHMLGINTPYERTPRPYRNYAAVSPGDEKFAELGRLGVIERYAARGGSEYNWLRCTQEGKVEAMRSHKTIRKSKGQRRYSAFLDLTDVFPGMTFKDFLTNPDFANIRNNA